MIEDMHADETKTEETCENCKGKDFSKGRDDDGYGIMVCDDCGAYGAKTGE